MQSGNYRVTTVYKVVQTVILWFLWKRRNTFRHGGTYSISRVFWEIHDTLVKFIKVKFNVDFFWKRLD